MSQPTPGAEPRTSDAPEILGSPLLDDLTVVGMRWQQGSAALSSLVLPHEGRGALLESLFGELRVREMFYLATCNRVQVAFLRCGRASPQLLRQQVLDALSKRAFRRAGIAPDNGTTTTVQADDLEVWQGLDALTHLSRVAAGLDSALTGEREIRGQLRDALRESIDLGLAGAALQRVVSGALQIANRVHEQTSVGDGRTSLSEIAIEEIARHVAIHPGPIALIGISEMTRRCAERLHPHVPLLLINRTVEKAEMLAEQLAAAGGDRPRVVELDRFRRQPEAVSAVVAATAADREILDAGHLRLLAERSAAAPKRSARSSQPVTLVIDFGVPANVDQHEARRLAMPCLGIDEISQRAAVVRERRSDELERAENLVIGGVEEVRRKLVQRSLSSVLKTLSERYHETAVEGLERMFERELEDLDESQRDVLLAWAQNLARRLAHVPILGLRGLAADEGNDAVTTFLRAADPTLLRSLDPALPANEEDVPAPRVDSP